jgi:uncharacterized protein YndB with AHSA1/START domain
MLLRVTTHMRAPVARVWELLCDWEGSAAWMVDATTVEVVGAQRAGVGTRIRAVTTVAGKPLTDTMVVSRWEPERLIEVVHEGWPIRGVAWFEIAPEGDGTAFEWAEELDPPFGPLGELGARLLRAPLERMLAKSLVKLRALAEMPVSAEPEARPDGREGGPGRITKGRDEVNGEPKAAQDGGR